MDRRSADTAVARRHGLRRSARPSPPTPSAGSAFGVDRTNPGDPRSPVGRMALLRTRLGFDCSSQPEHVHPHCDRQRRSLPLQCGCGGRPRPLSCNLPRCLRKPRSLLRGRRRHYGTGLAGPGAGAESPQPNRRRDPGTSRLSPQNRASYFRGWKRSRCPGQRDRRRRSAAHSPRRKSARRWR